MKVATENSVSFKNGEKTTEETDGGSATKTVRFVQL